MTRLALTSTLLGAAMIGLRLPGVLAPATERERLVKFPRSIVAGRILMGILAAISWVVMYRSATDEWAWARPLILVGVPVAYWLVIQYANSFLAIRAVAGLLLLLAKVAIDATDTSEKPLRLVLSVLAYIWVITAIWMAIAPHHFRDLIGYFTASDQRLRRKSLIGVVIGAVLVVLGLFAY
jgi:hypothetical protein